MISVIVPVYNAARYLLKTVESVQAQTFSDWELILVDDGSKDESLALAEKLNGQDSRIRVFSQQNSGAAAARNHGLSVASEKYPYALCLDSDDLLLPDAIETLRALLDAHPKAPAACGFLQDIDADGCLLTDFDRLEALTARRGLEGRRLVRRKPDDPVTFGDLCFQNPIITPGQVLIRKSALATVEAFETGLAYVEDYDLWWRLAMQLGAIAVTPSVVLLYRHHGASISGNKVARQRGAAAFRWRLLTYPRMTSEQSKIARLGYLCHCRAGLGTGAYYIRRGEIKHGLKHAALGVRDMLYYLRDIIRLRRLGAQGLPMSG